MKELFLTTNQIKQMERPKRDRELLLAFMRSLKAKGLLDMDIHGSVVDVFIHSELPRLNIPSNQITDEEIEKGLSDIQYQYEIGKIDLPQLVNRCYEFGAQNG